MERKVKLLVIAGPTGSGKSELALKAARLLDGEIVNADSLQVYRHFNIGTAKPTARMMAKVPHHLIDMLEPDRHFTMWDYKLAAGNAIKEIVSRKKTVLLVGGTGLYLKALLENLEGGAKPDPQLRAELHDVMESKGLAFLYEKLKSIAPKKAGKIHPNDRHRVIRALENALTPPGNAAVEKPPYTAVFFVLGGPRKLLYERINHRVKQMFEAGWVDETRSILSMGYAGSCKPFQSVGYRQIVQYLDGRLKEEELLPLVQKETRQYAKRQVTWFGRVKGAVWADSISNANEGGEALARFMADSYRNAGNRHDRRGPRY